MVRLKRARSSGSVIKPRSTSVPIRSRDSKVKTKVPHPTFSTVKLRAGCFFNLRNFRLALIGPKVRVEPPPSSVITACGKPTTVTVNPQVAVTPFASVAVQLTLVLPIGNDDPDGGVQVTLAPGQLSITVGWEKFTTGVQEVIVVTEMLAGH